MELMPLSFLSLSHLFTTLSNVESLPNVESLQNPWGVGGFREARGWLVSRFLRDSVGAH